MDDKLGEIAERLAEDIGWAQGPILAALQQARDLGREEAQAEVEQLRKALEGMVNCPVGGSGQRLPTPETVARARAALRGDRPWLGLDPLKGAIAALRGEGEKS